MRSNKRTSNTCCCVPGCKTYYEPSLSFHCFPSPNTKAKKIIRAKWIHALKISRKLSPSMRVCGKHFKNEDYFFNKRYKTKNYRLKQNAVPSQNLPKGSHDRKINRELCLQRSLRVANRHKRKGINSKELEDDEQKINEHNVDNELFSSCQHDVISEDCNHLRWCCVSNCKRSNEEVRLHCMPYLDEQLYNQWLDNIGRPDLKEMDPEKVYQTYQVCDDHFSEDMKIDPKCYSRSRLITGAFPTVFNPPSPSNSDSATIEDDTSIVIKTETPEDILNPLDSTTQPTDYEQVLNSDTEIPLKVIPINSGLFKSNFHPESIKIIRVTKVEPFLNAENRGNVTHQKRQRVEISSPDTFLKTYSNTTCNTYNVNNKNDPDTLFLSERNIALHKRANHLEVLNRKLLKRIEDQQLLIEGYRKRITELETKYEK